MFTTDDLAARFRLDVDDPLEGIDGEPDSESLWKTVEVFDYMTEAGDAVARATNSLQKVISLPVVADENVISLPRAVHIIRYARLVTAQRKVEVANQNEIMSGQLVCDYGQFYTGGSLRARGTPQMLARDRERKAVVLAPTPVQDDTLELQCYVTLSTPLLCGMPLPFLERPDIRLMLHYMKYLAYAKQDADTLDLTRSNDFKARFDNESEEREVELRRERRTPSPIRMEW